MVRWNHPLRVQVDVMIMYSPDIFSHTDWEKAELITEIYLAFWETNKAIRNSGIDEVGLFNLVRVQEVSCELGLQGLHEYTFQTHTHMGVSTAFSFFLFYFTSVLIYLRMN